MSVRPAKTQISLGIHPVWSESSLCAQCVAKDPMLLHVDSEDSDQTGRMPRLIWVFAGRTAILLVLSCRGSYTLGPKYPRYMYIRTYKQYTHVYWVQEIHERIDLKQYISSIYAVQKKKYFVFALTWKKYFGSRTVRKKSLLFIGRKSWGKNPATPSTPPPQKIKWSVPKQVFSWRGSYGVMLFFLVNFHCNKQYKKANKTDRHPRYPFFHCHLYRHYRNSSHVSCRVILTCAKIRFVLN